VSLTVVFYPVMPLLIFLFLFTQEGDQNRKSVVFLNDSNANDDHGHTGGAPKSPSHRKRRKDAGAGAVEIQPEESLKHFSR
jgi:hypothetical protein